MTSIGFSYGLAQAAVRMKKRSVESILKDSLVRSERLIDGDLTDDDPVAYDR
jgi:hypothetical protein